MKGTWKWKRERVRPDVSDRSDTRIFSQITKAHLIVRRLIAEVHLENVCSFGWQCLKATLDHQQVDALLVNTNAALENRKSDDENNKH